MAHHGRPSNEISRLREALKDADRRNAALAERAQSAELALREAWHANSCLQLRCDSYREEFTKLADENSALVETVAALRSHPVVVQRPREPMPDLRHGVTTHPHIGPKDGGLSPHITLNIYPPKPGETEPRAGEVWIKLDDADANEIGGGMADAAATMLSIALQCGAPLELLASKLVGLRGGPGGPVWKDYGNGPEPDREVDRCLSLLDYLGKWILVRICGHEPFVHSG